MPFLEHTLLGLRPHPPPPLLSSILSLRHPVPCPSRLSSSKPLWQASARPTGRPGPRDITDTRLVLRGSMPPPCPPCVPAPISKTQLPCGPQGMRSFRECWGGMQSVEPPWTTSGRCQCAHHGRVGAGFSRYSPPSPRPRPPPPYRGLVPPPPPLLKHGLVQATEWALNRCFQDFWDRCFLWS